MPEIPVKIMMNVGTPEQAFAFAQLPNAGVGLARLEFIINRQIGIHPKALLDLDDQLDGRLQGARSSERDRRVRQPARLLRHSASPRACRRIAAAFAPEPVIVRMSRLQVQRVRQPARRASSTSRTRRTR